MTAVPPPYQPPLGPPAAGRSKLPFIVGGAVVGVLALVAVLVLVLTGGNKADDARSVRDVADLAVAAAEDLDVDAGIDLLCEAPDRADVVSLKALISGVKEATGTDRPKVDYEISDVEGGSTGSFHVHADSDEAELRGASLDADITVGTDGDRSCISDIDRQ